MDVQRLTDANKKLKTEIWELRDVASNLDLEKEEITIENQSVKEENKNLEAKIDFFKAMAEDSSIEAEEMQALLSQLEETTGRLESKKQALQETNHTLRTEIQTISSQVDFCQDDQAVQEKDLSSMKQVMDGIIGYFWNLKSKIETTDRRYEEERRQVCELTQTLGELEQIREAQEDEMVSLRDKLEKTSLTKLETGEDAEAPSLLHEMVQAKLTQDSQAMKNSILLFLSRLLWLLLVAIACVGLVSFSIKFETFVFGKGSETGSWMWLFLDCCLESLSEALSLRHSRKPGGLRPY